MNKLRHMEMLRAKRFAASEKLTILSRLKSIKSRASVHFYRPQEKEMFYTCLFTKGEGGRQIPLRTKTLIQRPRKEHGTRQEVTLYTPSPDV